MVTAPTSGYLLLTGSVTLYIWHPNLATDMGVAAHVSHSMPRCHQMTHYITLLIESENCLNLFISFHTFILKFWCDETLQHKCDLYWWWYRWIITNCWIRLTLFRCCTLMWTVGQLCPFAIEFVKESFMCLHSEQNSSEILQYNSLCQNSHIISQFILTFLFSIFQIFTIVGAECTFRMFLNGNLYHFLAKLQSREFVICIFASSTNTNI